MEHEYTKQETATELSERVDVIQDLARRLGLDPASVKYWIVDQDEMNQLIAYDGFQRRYPHWRWGMKYEQQQKRERLGLGKAFEIVNNDDPAHAFLQVSNSPVDQKSVITHVEGHADFFANNQWFDKFNPGDESVVAILDRHADIIEEYLSDPEIDREEVESFIDTVLMITDTIDQYSQYPDEGTAGTMQRQYGESEQSETVADALAELDLSDAVSSQVLSGLAETDASSADEREPVRDVLGFILEHGRVYDAEQERAVEMADWQRDILEILRSEAYYFAPQKLTQVMNEGFATFWQRMMMSSAGIAQIDEVDQYADQLSKVTDDTGGLNPYALGNDLWEYIENRANRREVIEKLLRVGGVDWRTVDDDIDMDRVVSLLEPDQLVVDIEETEACWQRLEEHAADPRIDAAVLDERETVDLDTTPWRALTYRGLAERHYSLTRLGNRTFLSQVTQDELREESRYILADDQYETIEEAIDAVSYTAGWDRIYEVRESHNDVTFIDEFLTPEFIDENGYFAYEYSHKTDEYHVSTTDAGGVKQKLLLQYTNFGKPTIYAYDANYNNAGELLLGHQYNGVMLDIDQAIAVCERLYDIWGKPVNLATIVKEFPDSDDDEQYVSLTRSQPGGGYSVRRVSDDGDDAVVEHGYRIRYDGTDIELHDIDADLEAEIRASGVNYDTRPDNWLGDMP